MSKRYNLTLRNKKTGVDVSCLQLFGNNGWTTQIYGKYVRKATEDDLK